MQQDNNNIDNKLRQLDNQQLPDLSHMDEHWQQMQGMLQPPASGKPGKIKFPGGWGLNGLWILAGIIAVVVAGYFLTKEKTAVTKSTAVIASNNSTVPPVTNSIAATNPGDSVVQPNKSMGDSISNEKRSQKRKEELFKDFLPAKVSDDALLNNITINYTPCEGCPVKENGTDSVTSTINRAGMLDSLMTTIAKKAEKFTINNQRDTVLVCKEGTTLYVPANAFGGKDSVVFEVKEFYKYSDMVLNKLVTKSGDDQLISGGMLHLTASKNGTEVSMNPNVPIRVFIPGIDAADSMQVFNGVEKSSVIDTTKVIDWQLSNVMIDSPVIRMFIRAIDLRDNLAYIGSYYRGDKVKGVFMLSKQSAYGKDELKRMLKEKYGKYYDKIRVRKRWAFDAFSYRNTITTDDYEFGNVYNSAGVGDTAELLPKTISFYKLAPIDTVYRVVNWVHKGMKQVKQPVLTADMRKQIGEKYSIELDKLGWINCDRFNTKNERTSFVVDLKDSAVNYYTVLVFDKYKSIMSGVASNGTLMIFNGIPKGEPVKVISIGIDKMGRKVAAIKKTTISGQTLNGLNYEVIDTTTLQSSLSKIDQ